MRRLFFATATAAVVGLALQPATAAVIVTVDPFSVGQGPVEDLTLGGGGVSSGPLGYVQGAHNYTREFSVELLDFLAPIQSQAEVASGVFDILNGTGEKSEVILQYNIPASLQAFRNSLPNVTGLAYFFTLVSKDLNVIDISADFNGTPLAVDPPIGGVGIYRFDLPGGSVDGTLKLIFNGDRGYDLTIDNLRLWIGQNGEPFDPDVPAPAALTLFGLGLAAVGLRRRVR